MQKKSSSISRYMFVALLCFSVGCKTRSVVSKNVNKPATAENKSSYTKISLSETSEIKKTRAYALGKRVLMTCNTSKFKPFTLDEATSEVINNINQDKISLTCQNILRKFGQFKDMKLIDAYYYEATGMTVFRFKCDYEKKYDIKELQVSIDENDKVSAISTKNWSNTY